LNNRSLIMKRFIQSALVALGICSGCSKSDILTPAQFIREYADVFRKSLPGLKVEIVKDMELKVTAPDGTESTSFLDNAYDTYKQDPKSRQEIIKKFVAAGLETVASMGKSEELDRSLIVPIIKDRPWLEETRKAMMDRGAKQVPETVHEDLNSDLIILYAEDSPKNIRYFSPKDLEKTHIDRKELRSLACENLKRLLPKIERRGANGLFVLTAGGDYEASLLLFDSIWSDMKKDVQGDVVVAIPNRGLLVVTGSEDGQGIEKMKQIVKEASVAGSYRLTTKLFFFAMENLRNSNGDRPLPDFEWTSRKLAADS
jgi:uncharacterized protein YtpQ (UPF0354 family)